MGVEFGLKFTPCHTMPTLTTRERRFMKRVLIKEKMLVTSISPVPTKFSVKKEFQIILVQFSLSNAFNLDKPKI